MKYLLSLLITLAIIAFAITIGAYLVCYISPIIAAAFELPQVVATMLLVVLYGILLLTLSID